MEKIFHNEQLYDLLLEKELTTRRNTHPNPLNRREFTGFSQNGEDGITLEVFRRIGIKKGFFVEFGVGNGLENNTIILLAAGWEGAWFGGEEIALTLENSTKLRFEKAWVTRDNISRLYKSLNREADAISLDLDGNDIYLLEQLLIAKVQPKLFIVEYNAKFPPPLHFQIAYDDDHQWAFDDYLELHYLRFPKFSILLIID